MAPRTRRQTSINSYNFPILKKPTGGPPSLADIMLVKPVAWTGSTRFDEITIEVWCLVSAAAVQPRTDRSCNTYTL